MASNKVVCFVLDDVDVFVVVVADSSSEFVPCSNGMMIDLSCASPARRGRVARSRVVARRRWLQKAQCWVRIRRRVGEDIVFLCLTLLYGLRVSNFEI